MKQRWNLSVVKNLKNVNVMVLSDSGDKDKDKEFTQQTVRLLEEAGLKVFVRTDESINEYHVKTNPTLILGLTKLRTTNKYNITGWLDEPFTLERNGLTLFHQSWHFFNKYEPEQSRLESNDIEDGLSKLNAIARQFADDVREAKDKKD